MAKETGNKNSSEKSNYDIRIFKRLLSYSKKYWVLFLLSIIMLFASTLAELSRPYIVKLAIDNYLNVGTNYHAEKNPTKNEIMVTRKNDIAALTKLSLLFISAIILGFIFNFLQTYWLSFAAQNIIYNIREEIFSHVQKLPLSFFDKTPIGTVVTRVTNDTEALNEMYTNVLVGLIKDLSIFIGAIGLMFFLNVKLTLVILSIVPIIIIATIIFRSKVRSVYRNLRTILSSINSTFSENISGIRIIQIFNREKENLLEFEKLTSEYQKTGIAEIKIFGIFRPFIEMLSSFTVALVLWYGGNGVLNFTIQFGVLFAMINYIALFYQPITDLAEKFNILQSAMAASEKIFAILDTPTEEDIISTKETKKFEGNIEFKDVWFSYNEDQWILKDINLDIKKGEVIAIVGSTGSGKTTLVNLINRFYEIGKGTILIDGVDIKEISKKELRENIVMVPQDVFLFNTSVRENITLGKTEISNDEIKRICEYINANHFIDKLNNKYEEIISERGASISAGQRQLLSFARAMAYEPSILILDEATSNIDTETESLIQDALQKLVNGRTTIIIAHRISTIKNADKIVVIHKGKIREIGNHSDLMDKKGIYYNLYNLQYSKI